MDGISDFLRQHIQNLFAQDQREPAARKLAEASGKLPLVQGDRFVNDRERVLCAVLKLSGGDMAELDRHIREAQRDWRDVLMATGFGVRLESYKEWDSTR